MLMALLPLTGWAAPLRSVEALSPYFGEVPTINVYSESTTALTEGTDYTFDGFFTAKTCAESEKLTEDEVKAKPAGTTLWVKVSGKVGYEGSLTGSFVIKKMPLVILGAFETGKQSKAFGSADPTGTIFTVSKVYKKTDLAFATNIATTLGNIFTFVREPGEDADDYVLNATITNETTAKNYTVESEDIYTVLPTPGTPGTPGTVAVFTINPKEFSVDNTSTTPVTPGTVTITIDDSQLIYNGTNQKPTITVHDIALDKDLKLDTDYTVTYPTSGSPAVADHKTAITHNITITGKGNYATTGIPQTFTIAPRPVFVKPVFKKVYDGTANLATLPAKADGYVLVDEEEPVDGIYTYKFVFQGLIDKAAKDVDFDKTALKDNNLSTTQKDVTTSPVALKFVCADTKTINHVFTLANYTFIAQDGTLEITQRPVTVTAANSSVNYGDVEAEAAALKLIDDNTTSTPDVDEALVGAVFGQRALLRYIIKVTKASAAETTGANKGKYKLTPVWLGDGEIDTKVNAITKETYNALMGTSVTSVSNDQKKALKDALKALKADYNMTAVFGYLGYNKATLYLGLDESKFTLRKVYDGTEISLDDQKSKLADPLNLSFSGFQGSDKATDAKILDLSALKIEFVNNGADAKTYNLSLSGAKSDFYNISYVNSVYKIEQRPILLSIPKQIFIYDAVPSIVQNYAIETIKDAQGKAVANQGVVSTDDEADVFVLGFDDTKVTVNATTGKMETTETTNDIANGIIAVDPETEGSVFDNYKFSYTDGSGAVQIVTGGGLTILDETDDLTELTAAVNATVMFETERQIKKNVWASMVLPFNTTVRKVSKALGYAVVDMFIADESSEDMNFKIHMGEIPAYTPFLVKTDETINLNAVSFEKVDILELTDELKANLTQSNKNYNFIGNMKPGEVGAIHWTDGSSMTEDHIQFNKYRATHVMPALKAYITAKEGVSAAPHIFIEEPDGTTTAISTINADGEAVAKDGWFTLNGMRLEGAPTEKGVYINNGKKVVIK